MKMKVDSGYCTQECESAVWTLKDTQRRFAQISAMLSLAVFQGANLNQAAPATAAKAIAAFQCHVHHPDVQHVCAPKPADASPATTDVAWCKASNVSTTKRALVMPSFGNSIQRSSMQTRQLKMRRYLDLSYDQPANRVDAWSPALPKPESRASARLAPMRASSFTTRPINTKSQPSDISAVKTPWVSHL